jgi:hypothetical protein
MWKYGLDFNVFEVTYDIMANHFRQGSEPSGSTEKEVKKAFHHLSKYFIRRGPVSRSQLFRSTYEPNISLLKDSFSGSSHVAWLPLATSRTDDEGTIHWVCTEAQTQG